MARRFTVPSLDRKCVKCGGEIPAHKRADAAYCSTSCRDAAEKARYCAAHPEYVKRQRRLVNEIRHTKLFGHTRFLDDPTLNKRDRFRAARAVGFRSMLEVEIAKQLTALGVPFLYEPLSIPYLWPLDPKDLPSAD